MNDASKSRIQSLLSALPSSNPLISSLQQEFAAALQSDEVVRDFFVYSTTFSSLAAGASTTNNISIQADSDFDLLALSFEANIAGAAQTSGTFVYPNVTILLTDSGSGRQLMDSAVPVTSFFGNGQFPFILPIPKRFSARSNIVVQATSFEAANTTNLRLSFIGQKIFRRT